MISEEAWPEFQVSITISEEKWYWPALGAVPGALRRKYPQAAIDVVASARQAQLFAALSEVRQVTQTRPEEEYDLEISLGDRVEQRYSNEMLADDAAKSGLSGGRATRHRTRG